MIGHQAICMYPAVVLNSLLGEGIEVVLVITVIIEAGAMVVAPLDDMPGYARDNKTGTSRHSIHLCQNDSGVSIVDARVGMVCQ